MPDSTFLDCLSDDKFKQIVCDILKAPARVGRPDLPDVDKADLAKTGFYRGQFLLLTKPRVFMYVAVLAVTGEDEKSVERLGNEVYRKIKKITERSGIVKGVTFRTDSE